MTRSKVDFLLFLLSACFPLSPPLVDFSGLMMTRMKEQSQRGQRSRSHRLAHPMLRPLPCQPRVPSLRLSLVSRHFVSNCVCTWRVFLYPNVPTEQFMWALLREVCMCWTPSKFIRSKRVLKKTFTRLNWMLESCRSVWNCLFQQQDWVWGAICADLLKFPGVRRCESRRGLRRSWSLLV